MLDVLRAAATLRVVLYHASGDVHWSWVAAMPAMFFVGGALYGASLDRRPWQELLPHRLRRIVVPMWAWSLVVFAVYSLVGAWSRVPLWGVIGFVLPITPPVGPGDASDPLYWTWMALWYLNAYIVFMLVGIPLRKALRRYPRATVAAFVVPIVLSAAVGPNAIGGIASNLVFWLLGYWYHDHRDRLPTPAVTGSVALGAAVVSVGYGAAVSGFGVVVTSDPFLNATVGVAWVAGCLALQEPIEALARVRAVDQVVTWVQRRALTIYLWHALAVGIVAELAATSSALEGRVTRVAAVFALTFVVVLATGWIEDLAASRPATVWPLHRQVVDLRERARPRKRADQPMLG